MTTQPIKPPFNEETARLKVQAAEDAWNSREARNRPTPFLPQTLLLYRALHP